MTEAGCDREHAAQTTRVALHDKANQALHIILQATGTTQVTLPPLNLAQTMELISAAFSGVDVAPELGREIYDKTAGLPLYIEQASWACFPVVKA